MAPHDSAALGLQSNRRRPVPPTPIVPAIPLPFIQKRKNQAPAVAAPGAKVEPEGEPRVNGFVDGVEVESVDQAPPAVVGAAKVSAEHAAANGVQSLDTRRQDDMPSFTGGGGENADQGSSTLDSPPSVQPVEQGPGHGPVTEQIVPQFSALDYPSAPASAASAHFPSQPVQYAYVPYHHAYPSHGSIVFGGYSDTTSSSPAPPYVADVPDPPMRGSGGQNGAYHAKPELHASYGQQVMTPVDAAHPVAFPALFPPADLYFPRQHRFEHPHFRDRILSFAPSDGYTPSSPAGTPGYAHQSRTPSAAGSGGYAVARGSRNGSIVSGPARRTIAPEHGDVQPAYPADGWYNDAQPARNGAADQERPGYSPLQSHLASQLDNDEFADCIVQLRHTKRRFGEISIHAHRVLLSQSLLLKELLRNAPHDGSVRSIVSLETADRFLGADGFRMALRYLYGAPIHELLDACWALQPRNVESPAGPLDRTVEAVLGLAAAGALLQIDKVTSSAVRSAIGLIRWETLEKVLAFALRDLGNELSAQDEVLLKSITDDSVSATNDPRQGRAPAVSHPTYQPATKIDSPPYANQLLYAAMDFIIRHFPPEFVFDGSAPQLSMMPRLPDIKESTPLSSRHDPRLKSLRFGDHPSEEDVRRPSDPVTTNLSSVLLSLDFEQLARVLESAELGSSTGANGSMTMDGREALARSIIVEREHRRQKVLQQQTAAVKKNREAQPTPGEGDKNRWGALYWEESVEKLNESDGPTSRASSPASDKANTSSQPLSPASRSSTTLDHETPSSGRIRNQRASKLGFRVKRTRVGVDV